MEEPQGDEGSAMKTIAMALASVTVCAGTCLYSLYLLFIMQDIPGATTSLVLGACLCAFLKPLAH